MAENNRGGAQLCAENGGSKTTLAAAIINADEVGDDDNTSLLRFVSFECDR